MIICTGPAGSGKSTTLYAIARHILESSPHRSVVSLEDPVEQKVEGLTQIQVQPHGELNYVRALRSLLRQDVQVLLVGEIRDAETARVAIEAALTGHLVLTTMHSGDPAEALVRLMEMGAAPYQIVSAVTVVLAQRLLRKLCNECRGAGCDGCVHGYSGRTACGQMAIIDEGLRALVLERVAASRLRRYLAEAGPDLNRDAQRKVDAKITDRSEVLRVLGAD
jgi:type II secretory ATPase GspE/PulE/Tfp pilus assembly ATPase PilB-like protein